jgi:NDP-sugar pyrophosphorylase family protein
MNKINVLIPMAGSGTRFSEKGYSLPKPLIKIFGKPMIEHVIDSLNIDANYIFLVQKEHYVKYHLADVLDALSPGCKIVQVDGVTDGAARTTLLAKDLVDNDTPLVIANSDQVISWDSTEFLSLLQSRDVIALFRDSDPKWSYAEIKNNLVSRVAEKQVISDNASVGIYGWSKGSDYVKYAEQMIEKDIRTNNEFYICPVYNEAIQDGHQVVPFYVKRMHGVGTPEDMNAYINERIGR